jgi:hypothetical protein
LAGAETLKQFGRAARARSHTVDLENWFPLRQRSGGEKNQ